MNSYTDKLFSFVITILLFLTSVCFLIAAKKNMDVINIKEQVKQEFLSEGVAVGAIEYKIVDKTTGKTLPMVVIPKTPEDGYKISKWLSIPLYNESNNGYASQVGNAYNLSSAKASDFPTITIGEPKPVAVYIATFQAENVK